MSLLIYQFPGMEQIQQYARILSVMFVDVRYPGMSAAVVICVVVMDLLRNARNAGIK